MLLASSSYRQKNLVNLMLTTRQTWNYQCRE